MKVLVLDAMGVIYSVGDDVTYLLCPFVAEKGGTLDTAKINHLYNEASRGRISTPDFWRGAGLDPKLEDEYLARHQLTDGALKFLKTVSDRGVPLWCLSNDVSEWSRKLRVRFDLEKYFRGFIVSGDVLVRKPDAAIFKLLEERAGATPQDILYVDDSRKNLNAAAALGWRTLLFLMTDEASYVDPNPYAPQTSLANVNHPVIRSFAEVLPFLT